MTTRGLCIAGAVAAVVMLGPLPRFAVAAAGPGNAQHGANPNLPPPQRGLLLSMRIAEPASWGDRRPSVPQGWTIKAIATDLKVPRQTLVLPNGDILVAEGKGGGAPILRPKDTIAGIIKSKGTTSVKGGNQLTLLRDADGDGSYEGRWVYAENLNAPYGLALVGNRLYIANQDALVRLEYVPGQTRATAAPVTVARLPSAINHHWTKALAADADGRFLYVGIGSNSNIAERGMAVEENRAVVWQIDASSGATRTFATGLRNPTALAFEPASRQLWAVVNERDELGPDLVPDYLTSVREGAFYGWPYAYWGPNVDRRVQPQRPAGRLCHRFPGRRQNHGPPGRRDVGPQGRLDRGRRSVQHRLASDACALKGWRHRATQRLAERVAYVDVTSCRARARAQLASAGERGINPPQPAPATASHRSAFHSQPPRAAALRHLAAARSAAAPAASGPWHRNPPAR